MPVEFAYAQARAQARHGDRLSVDEWHLVESGDGMPQYLHSLRGTTLGPRVRHFTESSSPHAIERSLRDDWRAAVAAATGWVPRLWRPSVAWTAWLPSLPALSHLLHGGGIRPWMLDDPVLSSFAVEDLDGRRRAIDEALPGASTAAAGAANLVVWWTERWRASWPVPESRAAALEELVALLHEHQALMRDDALKLPAVRDHWHTLERRVLALMRSRLQQPLTVFCHLLLTALELRRLRSGLIRRSLFQLVVVEQGK